MQSSIGTLVESALVVAAHGHHFLVRSIDEGEAAAPPGRPALRVAVTRGKRTDPCVGDRVLIRALGMDQAVIESIEPRLNLLSRSDRWRTKTLAANIDQVGIVLAGDPPFSEELLLRMLCAASVAGIPATIIVNKRDLHDARQAIEPRIDAQRTVGIPIFDVAAAQRDDAAQVLRGWLAGRTSLLIGQSGMGKSTLVNALVPDADLRTQTISTALSTGRHTTTFSRLFELPQDIAPDARIIDTPGFQTFGLAHLSRTQLAHSMPEFAALIGACRFNDCLHRDEPGCAIRRARDEGRIDALRLQLYGRLVDDTLD